jgi:outer membrane lipoprotein-sorting protein
MLGAAMRPTPGLLSRSAVAVAVAFALAVTLSIRPPLASAGATSAHDAPLTLDTLMMRFRAMVGLSARYQEEKRIALLAQPLVSEGTVHYMPPSRIARHTLTPSPSSVVLDGGTLRLWDGVTEQSIDVTASPTVRAFVDSFLAVLAGDRVTLERTFVVDFRAPAGQKWQLGLVPRDASLGSILREVRFAGDDIVIAEMRIREASGDETVTTFLDVDTAHRYTDAEAARVFRLRK